MIIYNTEELILTCARKNLNDALKDKAVDLIEAGINWETFCNYAIKNGFIVLIYGALKKLSGFTDIPEGVLAKLRSASIFIISRSVFQERKLAKILELFAAEGIAVILLKGMLLAQRLYGDIAARDLSVDFDFLIKEVDKEKAFNALERINYILMPNMEAERYGCQYAFVKSKEAIIDLHLDITLTGRSEKRTTGLWQNAQMIDDGRMCYHLLGEEDILLYLCVCFVYNDCCENLKYLSDINQFLCNGFPIEYWESIIKKAGEWRLSASLYIALSMCKRLFNAPISEGILNKIKPSLIKSAFIGIFANRKFIFQDCRRKKFLDSCLGHLFFELAEAKTVFEYSNIIFRRILFPPKDVLLSNKRYRSKSVFIGYTLRLFRGFLRLLPNGRN